MLDIRVDGTLVFQEMFSGALEYFYKGVSGYIYHCTGEFELNEETGVPTCVTSDKPVPIIDFEYIEDVYEKIMEYEKTGTFIYEKFENLRQYRHDIIRGIIYRTIKKDNLFENIRTECGILNRYINEIRYPHRIEINLDDVNYSIKAAERIKELKIRKIKIGPRINIPEKS